MLSADNAQARADRSVGTQLTGAPRQGGAIGGVVGEWMFLFHAAGAYRSQRVADREDGWVSVSARGRFRRFARSASAGLAPTTSHRSCAPGWPFSATSGGTTRTSSPASQMLSASPISPPILMDMAATAPSAASSGTRTPATAQRDDAMMRPAGPGSGGTGGAPAFPARRGFTPGHRVELPARLGTVAARAAGYPVDESTVWVTWDNWPGKPSPSPEAARLLLLASRARRH